MSRNSVLAPLNHSPELNRRGQKRPYVPADLVSSDDSDDSDVEIYQEDFIGEVFLSSDDDDIQDVEPPKKVPVKYPPKEKSNEVSKEKMVQKEKDKTKQKELFKNRVADYRNKVLKFFNEANSSELYCIPGISKKKIDLILPLRPFDSWDDLKNKLNQHKRLSVEILKSGIEVVKARESVESLMKSCQQISNDIQIRVDRLEPVDQPQLLNSDLRLKNYQLIGLNWLTLMFQKRLSCILADEMGLGKTIQVIALLAHLRELRIRGPHLIVVPATTMDNWLHEVRIKFRLIH